MLEPAGPGAETLATMWWVLFGIMTVVFLIVMTALGLALYRHRKVEMEPPEEGLVRHGREEERRRVKAVVLAGAAIPAVILIGILVYTLEVLDEIGPSAEDAGALTVEIVGKQFWWEIRYPLPTGDTVVTANELHIPAGQRVRLLLDSDDVIHSVWVPRLHGKTDMIPGRTTEMWLAADEPGVYWGQCAEYCGEQHTWMKMLVIAQTEEEFQGWLQRERRPALPAPPSPDPADEALQEPGPPVADSLRQAVLARNQLIRRGREVFLDPVHRCAVCHTIRGVSERAEIADSIRRFDGPDLTHVASRLTLAAGLLRTNRGNMGGWISNPQVLKPGNLMPRIPLEPEEMNALIEYLMSLQ